MIQRIWLAAFALAVMLPAVAHADPQGILMQKRWVGSDRCSQQAFQAYPDYTAESLVKRDLALKQCLARGNLPPRDLPPPNQP